MYLGKKQTTEKPWARQCVLVISALGRSRKEDEQFKVIFRMLVTSRSAWTSCDPVPKEQSNQKQKYRVSKP